MPDERLFFGRNLQLPSSSSCLCSRDSSGCHFPPSHVRRLTRSSPQCSWILDFNIWVIQWRKGIPVRCHAQYCHISTFVLPFAKWPKAFTCVVDCYSHFKWNSIIQLFIYYENGMNLTNFFLSWENGDSPWNFIGSKVLFPHSGSKWGKVTQI